MHLFGLLLLISVINGFFYGRNAVLKDFTKVVESGNLAKAASFLEKHKENRSFECLNELKEYHSNRCVKVYDALYKNPEILSMVLDIDCKIKPQAFLTLTTFRAILEENDHAMIVFNILIPYTRYSELAFEQTSVKKMLWIDAIYLRLKRQGHLTPAKFALLTGRYQFAYLSLTQDTVDFTERQLTINNQAMYLRAWLVQKDDDCDSRVLGHNKPVELQQIINEMMKKGTNNCIFMLQGLIADNAKTILNGIDLLNVPYQSRALFLSAYPTINSLIPMLESEFTLHADISSNLIKNLQIYSSEWSSFIANSVLSKLLQLVCSNPIEKELTIPTPLLNLVALSVGDKEKNQRNEIFNVFLSRHSALNLRDNYVEKLKSIWSSAFLYIADCPVCCNPITLSNRHELECKHAYCMNCVAEWKRVKGNKASCPECRVVY